MAVVNDLDEVVVIGTNPDGSPRWGKIGNDMTFEFVTVDLGLEQEIKNPTEFHNYEIWIGKYHLGQGYAPPTEPQQVGLVRATSFKSACFIHELQSEIKSLNSRMRRGDDYIHDAHFGKIYYDPKRNANSWTGKYYQSKEEALESFK